MEPVTKPTEALTGLETPPRWGCMNNNERLFLFISDLIKVGWLFRRSKYTHYFAKVNTEKLIFVMFWADLCQVIG